MAIPKASRAMTKMAITDIKRFISKISLALDHSHDGLSPKLMIGFFMPSIAFTINSTKPP